MSREGSNIVLIYNSKQSPRCQVIKQKLIRLIKNSKKCSDIKNLIGVFRGINFDLLNH